MDPWDLEIQKLVVWLLLSPKSALKSYLKAVLTSGPKG